MDYLTVHKKWIDKLVVYTKWCRMFLLIIINFDVIAFLALTRFFVMCSQS